MIDTLTANTCVGVRGWVGGGGEYSWGVMGGGG